MSVGATAILYRLVQLMPVKYLLDRPEIRAGRKTCESLYGEVKVHNGNRMA